MYRRILLLISICVLPLAACESENQDLGMEGEIGTDTTQLGADTLDNGLLDDDFTQDDRNADGALDDTEFSEAGYFEDWDADDDSLLSAEEFGQGIADADVFAEWDENGDTSISQDEFAFDDTEWFSAWDENADQQLTEDEFNAGSIELWDEDADGYLDEDEFLGIWDIDDSGLLEQEEYADAREWLE